MLTCDRCGKIVANAGNLAQHSKRCHYMAPRYAGPSDGFGIERNPNASDLQTFQTDRDDLRAERQVSSTYLVDVCDISLSQISSRYLQDVLVFQDGWPFAPFENFTDAAWAKRTVEDGIGKAKRQRMMDTVRHASFKPEEMVVTSEKKRKEVMDQFPGVKRYLQDI